MGSWDICGFICCGVDGSVVGWCVGGGSRHSHSPCSCGPMAETVEKKTGRKRKKRIEPRIEQIGGECETDFRPKEGILDPDGG